MKKKVGELYDKPIVIGNPNEFTKDEIDLKSLKGGEDNSSEGVPGDTVVHILAFSTGNSFKEDIHYTYNFRTREITKIGNIDMPSDYLFLSDNGAIFNGNEIRKYHLVFEVKDTLTMINMADEEYSVGNAGEVVIFSMMANQGVYVKYNNGQSEFKIDAY